MTRWRHYALDGRGRPNKVVEEKTPYINSQPMGSRQGNARKPPPEYIGADGEIEYLRRVTCRVLKRAIVRRGELTMLSMTYSLLEPTNMHIVKTRKMASTFSRSTRQRRADSLLESARTTRGRESSQC